MDSIKIIMGMSACSIGTPLYSCRMLEAINFIENIKDEGIST